MKVQVDGKLDMRKLDEFNKQLTSKDFVGIGVFGDHNNARVDGDGLTNVELGVIQEFGSISNNIPPRSFIRMPINDKKKEIVAFANSRKMKEMIASGQKKKALGLIGVFCENIIQKAFDTGGFGKWAPNKPATIAKKGSAKPLIDHAELRKAIWSKVTK